MPYRFLSIVIFLCLIILQGYGQEVFADTLEKQRVVLMPLKYASDQKNARDVLEASIIEALSEKYVVFSGEKVAKRAREIFNKESKSVKGECDETRCMQDIAASFQSELIAVSTIAKLGEGYLFAINIQNIFDNTSIYSKSLTCEKCTGLELVDKVKELVNPENIRLKQADDSAYWAIAKSGNTVDGYRSYINRFPKGKHYAEAIDQSWSLVKAKNSKEGYEDFLEKFPGSIYERDAKNNLQTLSKYGSMGILKDSGYYVSFDYYLAKFDLNTEKISVVPNGANIFNSKVYGIGGGYKINRYWSAEVGFRVFGDEILNLNGANTYTASTSMLTMNMLGRLPIKNRFGGVGRLGVANMMIDEKTTSPVSSQKVSAVVPYWALGIDYVIDENLVVQFIMREFMKAPDQSRISSVSDMGMSLQYYFD